MTNGFRTVINNFHKELRSSGGEKSQVGEYSYTVNHFQPDEKSLQRPPFVTPDSLDPRALSVDFEFGMLLFQKTIIRKGNKV